MVRLSFFKDISGVGQAREQTVFVLCRRALSPALIPMKKKFRERKIPRKGIDFIEATHEKIK